MKGCGPPETELTPLFILSINEICSLYKAIMSLPQVKDIFELQHFIFLGEQTFKGETEIAQI